MDAIGAQELKSAWFKGYISEMMANLFPPVSR